MTKTYTIDNTTYTVRDCTAIPVSIGETYTCIDCDSRRL